MSQEYLAISKKVSTNIDNCSYITPLELKDSLKKLPPVSLEDIRLKN